jgi:hypothetical protein
MMTTYGILVVDTSWANQDSVQVDKTTYLRHKDRLIEGAQALIYVRQPVDAIVAEAELRGNVIQTETEPEEPALNPASVQPERQINPMEQGTESPVVIHPSQQMEKTFRVPLKVVRLKGGVPSIPSNQLQMILGSDFTVFDETWIPLNESQYEAIVAFWEKG